MDETPSFRGDPSLGSGRLGTGKVSRQQLSDVVAGAIRDRIMSGGLKPGTAIRMDETAAELGVSVTPVREALLTLKSDGMVAHTPHKGYRVADLTRSDIRDVVWLQSQLGAERAGRASRRMTSPVRERLVGYLDQLVEAVEAGSADEIERVEFEYYRELNRLADAPKLSGFLVAALRYTPVRFYSSDRGWGDAAVASLRDLLDAIDAGDHTRAGEISGAHFRDGAERLIVHLEAGGFWD